MYKKKSLKKRWQFNVGNSLATLFIANITIFQGYLRLHFEMKHVHLQPHALRENIALYSRMRLKLTKRFSKS